MKDKIYTIVGNWSFQARPSKGKGITIFSYDQESGALTLIETIRPDIAAGQLCVDHERNIIYVCNECGEQRGMIGGGGYIMAFRFDTGTGKLKLINEKPTLSAEPSFICMDKERKYLTVCHCADPWHVTKVVRREDGSFGYEVLFDDAGLTLFRINDDGSIGDICDVAVQECPGGTGKRSKRNVDPVSGHIQLIEVISRLHSVYESPSGSFIIVCDKGLDKIYSYRVDRAQGRLVKLSEWYAEEAGCFPRYGAFHPTLKVFYANNENSATVNAFHYDDDTGELELFQHLEMMDEDYGLVDGKAIGAQDILVHPNGRWMYVTLCGLDLIVVMQLDEEGRASVVQRIPSGGVLPRGVAFSPDLRYFLAGNMVSGDITTFTVGENGTLTPTGRIYKAVSPSAIRFIS